MAGFAVHDIPNLRSGLAPRNSRRGSSGRRFRRPPACPDAHVKYPAWSTIACHAVSLLRGSESERNRQICGSAAAMSSGESSPATNWAYRSTAAASQLLSATSQTIA